MRPVFIASLLAVSATAAAGEPLVLSESQLDQVTAGGNWTLTVDAVTPGTTHELTRVVQQGQSPAGGKQVDLAVHHDGQIIVLTVGPQGDRGDSHDRFASIEVSYPLPAPGGR